MINLKKIVIVILVLFLILLIRKKYVNEKFFNKLKNDTHPKDVTIKIYYKENCSISTQFLYGCCKPFNDTYNDTESDIISIKKEEDFQSPQNNSFFPELTPTDNDYYDDINCMDHKENRLKYCFYEKNNGKDVKNFNKNVKNYNNGNKCMPTNYFTYETELESKNEGCVLKTNSNGLTKPTYYYLKKFIDYVNLKYKQEIKNKVEDTNFKFTLQKNGVESIEDELDYFNFHIHIELIEDANLMKGISSFPLIKVEYINDNDKYIEHDYTGDVNNFDNLVNFLDEKIKIEVSDEEISFNFDGQTLKKTLKYFWSDIDFNENNPSPSDSKISFLKTKFEEFKDETDYKSPYPMGIPYNLSLKYRDEDMESRINSSSSYLLTRPRIYFDNVKNDTHSLMIIFQDKILKEYYGSTNSQKNLIYWMMWNIPPNIPYLEEKRYDKIQNVMKGDGNHQYFELFPYKIFDPKTTQFYNRKCHDKFGTEFKEDFKKKIIDRQLEIQIKVISLNKEKTKLLNQKYFEYKNSNISKFYQHIFEDLFEYNFSPSESSEAEQMPSTGEHEKEDEEMRNIYKEERTDKNGNTYDKKYYSLKYGLDGDELSKLYKFEDNKYNQSDTAEYNKILTAFSELKFKESISSAEKNINFGRKGYWILKFDEADEATKINIGNQTIYLDTDKEIYRIPKYCSNIDINIEEAKNLNLHYFYTERPTMELDWYDIITTKKEEDEFEQKLYKPTEKFKAYKCLADKIKTNWLINFSIDMESSIEINNKEYKNIAKKNFKYITDKVNELNFTIETDKVYNGTITPFNGIEIDFTKDISEKNNYTKKIILPKKGNWLLQIENFGKTTITIDIIIDGIKINPTTIDTNTLFHYQIKDKKEFEITFNTVNIDFSKIYGRLIEDETQEIEKERVLNINYDIYNCQYINNLPKITWENKDIYTYKTDNPDDYINYGVEIFNFDNEEDVYYLEWDIEEKETIGKVFRNKINDNENTVTPFSTKQYREVSINSNIFDVEGKAVNKSNMLRNFEELVPGPSPGHNLKDGIYDILSINDQNCYKTVGTDVITIELRADKIKGIEGIEGIEDTYNMNSNKLYFENNNNKFYIKYNKNLKKWMLWEKKKKGEMGEIYIWVASQESSNIDLINYKQTWYFSPKYNKESFNFYNYPNPADEFMDIDINDTKLLKVDLKFESTETTEKYRCDNDMDKYGAKRDNDRMKDNIFKDTNKFQNTLFNFLSKINLENDQEKIEVETYELGGKTKSRLVYNLKLKCRVSSYKKKYNDDNTPIDSSIQEINNFNNTEIVNNYFSNSEDSEDKGYNSYERVLSEMVKKNYINQDVLGQVILYIDNEVEKFVKTTPNLKSIFDGEELSQEEQIRYRTFIAIEDCLTDILLYRGDLSKVNQDYLPLQIKQNYKDRLLYSMDEKDEKILNNPSSNPVIMVNAVIDKDLVNLYRLYVNNEKYKVQYNNYTSYGDLNLYQNETMLIYRIPLDIDCPKFKDSIKCNRPSPLDNYILLIKKKTAEFLQAFYTITYYFKESQKSLTPAASKIDEIAPEDYYVENNDITKNQIEIIKITQKIEALFNEEKYDETIKKFNLLIEVNKEYKNKKIIFQEDFWGKIKEEKKDLDICKEKLKTEREKLLENDIYLFSLNEIPGPGPSPGHSPGHSPDPSPGPSPGHSPGPGPYYDTKKEYEEKGKAKENIIYYKDLNDEIPCPYLNKYIISVPPDGDLILNLYGKFDRGLPPSINQSPEESPSPTEFCTKKYDCISPTPSFEPCPSISPSPSGQTLCKKKCDTDPFPCKYITREEFKISVFGFKEFELDPIFFNKADKMKETTINNLNFRREIIPIMNLYALNFRNLDNTFKQINKELNDISGDLEQKLIEKRKIISKYNEDIKLLIEIVPEIINSSQFIMKRYEYYNPNNVEEKKEKDNYLNDYLAGLSLPTGFEGNFGAPAFKNRSTQQIKDNEEEKKKQFTAKKKTNYYNNFLSNLFN